METTLHDLMTRRSVRSYTDEMPPKEVIEDILKAGAARARANASTSARPCSRQSAADTLA